MYQEISGQKGSCLVSTGAVCVIILVGCSTWNLYRQAVMQANEDQIDLGKIFVLLKISLYNLGAPFLTDSVRLTLYIQEFGGSRNRQKGTMTFLWPKNGRVVTTL